MNSPPLQIQPGYTVTLHFSLSFTDGTQAISTFGEEPLTFQMGDDTLRQGMEMALYGLKAGDQQMLTLTPGQAYGEPDPELIQTMPLSDFKDISPEPGQIINFTLPSGEGTLGRVRKIDTDQVEVDFNHPLAGQAVVFKVEILNVMAS